MRWTSRRLPIIGACLDVKQKQWPTKAIKRVDFELHDLHGMHPDHFHHTQDEWRSDFHTFLFNI